jgi:hypothetical protein
MNTNKLPVLHTVWTHRQSTAGRITIWGSAIQLPFLGWLLFKATSGFPQQGTDELLLAALLHLAIPVGLIGAFIEQGSQLNFKKSTVLTAFLLVMAVAPFAVSLPLLK